MERRAQLLASVFRTLNAAGLRYCVLSGFDATSPSDSDVDIMFHPGDLKRVPALLAQAARADGAVLAQAIQHETSATYFVLARVDGAEPAHLAVDCYGDYVRDGRTWLRAEQVVTSRRSYRDFYLPAIADEFRYYLIKKILKRSISSSQLKALQHLFARCPAECRQSIVGLLPANLATVVERAIVAQDLQRLNTDSDRLLAEIRRSAHVIGFLSRCVLRAQDAARCIRRVVRPTGMHVAVIGRDAARCRDLADVLQSRLRCLFRRTAVLQPSKGVRERLRLPLRLLFARICSTLVMCTAPDLRLPPDLIIGIADSGEVAGEAQTRHSNVLWVDASASDEELITAATQAVIASMAERVATRMRLQDSNAAGRIYGPANKVQLEAAGTD